MDETTDKTNEELIDEHLVKTNRSMKSYVAGLAACVLGIAVGGYMIHPGLGVIVVASALGSICHVNATALYSNMLLLRRSKEFYNHAGTQNVAPTHTPGGYA